MESEDKKMRGKVVGLNKAQVDEYINELRKEREQKLNELRNKIAECKQETGAINKKIAQIEKEETSLLKKRELTEFALSRTENVASLLKEIAVSEAKQIMLLAGQKLSTYDMKIKEACLEMRATEEHLDNLLKNVPGLIKSEIESLEQDKRFFNSERKDEDGEYIPDINDDSGINDKLIKNEEPEDEIDENLLKGFENKRNKNSIAKQNEAQQKDNKVIGEDVVRNQQPAKEINYIRNRYIVGKIAGENLLDDNASLIISKGEVITEEILARAEAEGKLAELIINMVLPGMEK